MPGHFRHARALTRHTQQERDAFQRVERALSNFRASGDAEDFIFLKNLVSQKGYEVKKGKNTLAFKNRHYEGSVSFTSQEYEAMRLQYEKNNPGEECNNDAE